MDNTENQTTPETKLCRYCRSEMDKKAKVCPTCHKKQSKKGGCLIVLIILAAVILIPILLFSACFKAVDDAIESDKQEKGNNKVVAEEVLYDENDVKITYTGMIEDTLGININLLVENSSDKSVTVQVRDFSIDGSSTDAICSIDVAPGTKTNDDISIFSSEFEKNSLVYKDIKEAKLKFHIFDMNSIMDSYDTDEITIKLR